jgi:hypothetical protein
MNRYLIGIDKSFCCRINIPLQFLPTNQCFVRRQAELPQYLKFKRSQQPEAGLGEGEHLSRSWLADSCANAA